MWLITAVYELVNDISRHKRELSKTRQAFKVPRVSRRKKPSDEEAEAQMEIVELLGLEAHAVAVLRAVRYR